MRTAPRKLESLPNLDLIQACGRLAAIWGLSPQDLAELLGATPGAWAQWLDSPNTCPPPRWSREQRGRARAIALLAVFELAGDLHRDDEDLDVWPRQALTAPGFDGRTPLEVMRGSLEGLLRVRDFLRGVLGSLAP